MALGTELPALFCNNDEVAAELLAAGEAARDPLWRLPLHKPYRCVGLGAGLGRGSGGTYNSLKRRKSRCVAASSGSEWLGAESCEARVDLILPR